MPASHFPLGLNKRNWGKSWKVTKEKERVDEKKKVLIDNGGLLERLFKAGQNGV